MNIIIGNSAITDFGLNTIIKSNSTIKMSLISGHIIIEKKGETTF